MKNKIKKFLVKGNICNQDNRKNAGITLVALVITIIILLILAGTTIGLAMNHSGLFEKTKLATEEYNNKVEQEETELGNATNEIESYIDGNRDTVTIPKDEYQMLKNANAYSTEERRIGEWIDGSNVYKKTFITKTPSSNGGIIEDITNLNIKEVVNSYGKVHRGDIMAPINYAASSGDMFSIYFDSDYKTMKFWAQSNSYYNKDAIITIEYIKN